MKHLPLLAFLIVALNPGVPPARAQDLLALGLEEAREHCARCHPAILSGRADRTEAARLRRVAQSPDPRAHLAGMLAHGHAGLSPETFSQAELGSLAAYLAARKW